MLKKYTAEGVGKQKFVVGNYYKWEMVDNKDIKLQINEYHKLLEELKAEKIELPEQFVAGLLIEKLPDSWSEYKQQLSYTAEGVGKQKFVVGNYYKWEMVDNKDIKLQINEYHKLLEELKVEKNRTTRTVCSRTVDRETT